MNNHQQQVSRRQGVLAVHSIDLFVFTVPDLEVAAHFYTHFGLQVKRFEVRIDLYTFGHPHCWGSVFEAPGAKKLQYFRYGIFADDEDAFRKKISDAGLMAQPHPLWTQEVMGYGQKLPARNFHWRARQGRAIQSDQSRCRRNSIR